MDSKNETQLFRWNPGRDLLMLVVSWILVVSALWTATFIATSTNGLLYFFLYGIVGATLFGIGIPVVWMVKVRKQSLSSLGITKYNFKRSIAIQILLTVMLWSTAYRDVSLPAVDMVLPLIALALAIGFFEAIFWRGWMQLRLEAMFGVIPGILLASMAYAVYHIGYGMQMSEIMFLFFIGLMFAIVFRFTKSIFILWPFFQPLGQLVTLIKDKLTLPTIATLGFVEVLALMVMVIWLVWRSAKKSRKENK